MICPSTVQNGNPPQTSITWVNASTTFEPLHVKFDIFSQNYNSIYIDCAKYDNRSRIKFIDEFIFAHNYMFNFEKKMLKKNIWKISNGVWGVIFCRKECQERMCKYVAYILIEILELK